MLDYGRVRPTWRLAYLAVCAGLASGAVGAPKAEAAPPSPATVEAQKVWDSILTRCGESYFYAGSMFDSQGMASDVQVGHQGTLEYRGVRFNAVPIRVTDAERANGLSSRTRISMIAHLYREGGGAWQDGPDLQPRNTDDMIGKALGQANSDMFDMGGAGAIALELVRFKGTWAVARSSTTSTDSIVFNRAYYDVDKLAAAKTAKYSCARSEVVHPPLTLDDRRQLAVQQALRAGRSQDAAAHIGDETVAIERDKIHIQGDPRKGVPFVAVSAAQMAAIKQIAERVDETGDNPAAYGQALDDQQKLWGSLEDRFPTTPLSSQWIAPGSSYTVECHGDDGCDWYRAQSRLRGRSFVVIHITSGPLAGQYAMIDEDNLNLTKAVEANGLAGYGSVN